MTFLLMRDQDAWSRFDERFHGIPSLGQSGSASVLTVHSFHSALDPFIARYRVATSGQVGLRLAWPR